MTGIFDITGAIKGMLVALLFAGVLFSCSGGNRDDGTHSWSSEGMPTGRRAD